MSRTCNFYRNPVTISLICFFTSSLLVMGCSLSFCHYLIIQGAASLLTICAVLLSYINFDDPFHLKIAFNSCLLGTFFSIGITISCFNSRIVNFGWYTIAMVVFHFSEFLTIGLTNPRTLSSDSFMLNHSVAYGTAALAGWIEYAVEYYFIPSIKELIGISIFGVVLCIVGEILRKLAMFTAKTNFTHIIQTSKNVDHVLVTHGVYSICRHPSYVGWFYWALGTQLILINPLCLIVYAMASWNFFKIRIKFEEESLREFFGNQYDEYKMKVPSGIPLINGYQINKQKESDHSQNES